MASKIRVTLTRVYEYDISKIQAKLKKAGYNDDEISDTVDILKIIKPIYNFKANI